MCVNSEDSVETAGKKYSNEYCCLDKMSYDIMTKSLSNLQAQFYACMFVCMWLIHSYQQSVISNTACLGVTGSSVLTHCYGAVPPEFHASDT